MTKKPATYSTFWIVFLHQEPTLLAAYRLARDFIFYRGPASFLAALLIIYSSLFILIFPTLASAMTGYNSAVEAFIKDPNNNLINFADFKRVVYIIHDGERVGLSNETVLPLTRGSKISRDNMVSKFMF